MLIRFPRHRPPAPEAYARWILPDASPSVHDARRQLLELALECEAAAVDGLERNRAYIADLNAEASSWRAVLVGVSVAERAARHGAVAGRIQG